METQGPGYSMTQELDWRNYDDLDETCLPDGADEASTYSGDCPLGNTDRQLYDLTQTSNLQGVMESHEQNCCSNIDKSMSISEISTFLLNQGIPQKYCDVFKGKE